jgi:hypothetical protein
MTHPKNILTEDVLQAYDELGGIKYLEQHPELLQRILLKIVNTPDPAPSIIIDMTNYAPWMDWKRRLSYRQGEDIGALPSPDDVTDIVPRALPSGEAQQTGNPISTIQSEIPSSTHEAQTLELERSWKPSTISPQQEFDRLPPLPPRSKPDIEIK